MLNHFKIFPTLRVLSILILTASGITFPIHIKVAEHTIKISSPTNNAGKSAGNYVLHLIIGHKCSEGANQCVQIQYLSASEQSKNAKLISIFLSLGEDKANSTIQREIEPVPESGQKSQGENSWNVELQENHISATLHQDKKGETNKGSDAGKMENTTETGMTGSSSSTSTSTTDISAPTAKLDECVRCGQKTYNATDIETIRITFPKDSDEYYD